MTSPTPNEQTARFKVVSDPNGIWSFVILEWQVRKRGFLFRRPRGRWEQVGAHDSWSRVTETLERLSSLPYYHGARG